MPRNADEVSVLGKSGELTKKNHRNRFTTNLDRDIFLIRAKSIQRQMVRSMRQWAFLQGKGRYMNVPTKLPVEAREKIYREALTKIRENLDEWYRGDKFFNSGLGHNDGKFLVSEVELIVGIAMDEGGGSYDI